MPELALQFWPSSTKSQRSSKARSQARRIARSKLIRDITAAMAIVIAICTRHATGYRTTKTTSIFCKTIQTKRKRGETVANVKSTSAEGVMVWILSKGHYISGQVTYVDYRNVGYNWGCT